MRFPCRLAGTRTSNEDPVADRGIDAMSILDRPDLVPARRPEPAGVDLAGRIEGGPRTAAAR